MWQKEWTAREHRGRKRFRCFFRAMRKKKTEKAQARRQKNQQNESTFIVGWKMGTHESVVMMHRRNADGIRDCEREGRKEKCRNPEKGRKNGDYGNTRKRGQMGTEQSRKNSGFSEKKI